MTMLVGRFWSVLAAIVVISAAMRVLGLDVVEWIRLQLGV